MKKYQLISDPEYGYLRVDPKPSKQEVEKFYKEDFYTERKESQINDSSLEVQIKDKYFFDSRWNRIYDVCESVLGNLYNKKIYDIGFGFAQGLIFYKNKGLICSGIEPSNEAVEYAKQKGIDNVFVGDIEGEKVYENTSKQDIVLLINVLEHLRNPANVLKQIKHNLLKDEGVLVIDVPNEFNAFQEVANTEFDLKEWWVSPPSHINYFTVKSLIGLLEKIGFEIKVKESSFPMEMFLLFGEVYVGDSLTGSNCHEKRKNFEERLIKNGHKEKLYQFYEKLAELELGRQITIYATPKG